MKHPTSSRRLPLAFFAFSLLVTLVATPSVNAAQPKIKIGYNTDDLEKAKNIGFDYAEVLVRNFTMMSDAKFEEFLAKHKAVGLPTPVGNNFIPADLPLVGPNIEPAKQTAF